MADVEFRRFAPGEAAELVRFLVGETWPFHVSAHVDPSEVRLDDASSRTFWIVADGADVGMLRLFDLDDYTPMFDIRLRAVSRGMGFGTRAVEWLTAYVFTEFPGFNRIEANTRQDNRAMRRVLRRCGYVKESHYRQAWPGPDGPMDSVGYAILRDDWVSGTATVPDFHNS